MDSADYEKLGVFYLGRVFDPEQGLPVDDLLLYDSKDLTTHALIVGMTGSGKTGLGLGLLEEAAIDGLPALVIDPKGDLANLALTFPDLRAADFEPWIDPAEAARKGRTAGEHAAAVAEDWRQGLADWGQDGARIRRFKEAADVAIYTPGSGAGLPLSILRSFDAPSEPVRADRDALRERVEGAVSGLLALLGIAADPVQSREHILLANLLDRAWREGRNLDLGQLIGEIQKPPFDKLGVIDLETFYPAAQRMTLALSINGLLASPGFAAWLEGEPLDVGRLLYSADGRPRISIVSISHLSDAERMFVVTLLLNEVVSWMRAQSGTSSLRALLYMDEIFGFFPPTAMPPSKQPMLTLLKQARAFGLGVVLATQNPVDLDYKGLSNCGSWFIGRLQTERDMDRVLTGLESASAAASRSFDRRKLEATIGSLAKRVFLLNNVHEDQPVLFQTRWVLSYLRGPLVRSQIDALMAQRRSAPQAATAATAVSTVSPGPRPVPADRIEEAFLGTLAAPVAAAADAAAHGAGLVYQPWLLGTAQLHFKNAKNGVDVWRQMSVLAPLVAGSSRVTWEGSEVHSGAGPPTRDRPLPDARFAELPPSISRAKAVDRARKSLADELYRSHTLTLWSHPGLGLTSEVDEDEGAFRLRVRTAAAERRDLEVEKLRAKYGAKIQALETKIRSAEERIERERSQLSDRKLQTAVSFGASVLGALMGRKKLSVTNLGRAGRALRDVGRSRREKDDVGRAEDKLEDLVEDKGALERELQAELEEVAGGALPATAIELAAIAIRPLKSDITVERFALLWAPYSAADGVSQALFELG